MADSYSSIIIQSMSKEVTSIFKIDCHEEGPQDYKALYEQERRKCLQLERKVKLLELKIKAFMKGKQQNLQSNKLFDMRSFKHLLPNSVHFIPPVMSDQSIGLGLSPPIMREWAIYGVPEEAIQKSTQDDQIQGELICSSQNPSQIVQHAAKLVFPAGVKVKYISGEKARQKCIEIVSFNYQKVKAFVLSFEPNEDMKVGNKIQILDRTNPQGRIFAIGIELQDFSLLAEGQGRVWGGQGNEVLAGISRRIYCIFTDYPFFSFFEEIIKGVLLSAKVDRYNRLSEGGQNLWLADSLNHTELVKSFFQEFKSSEYEVEIGRKLQAVAGSLNVQFQIDKHELNTGMAQDWAFPVLSLFTLDTFLQVFTLITLQQKVVFVCNSMPILTLSVLLFAQILIRPFAYPYPVVPIIPDQEDYLNAPFPLVYGLLKSKEELINSKIAKNFKNVYVVLEPTGVEVICEENKASLLQNTSPKLRDKLITKFKKMHKNYPKSSKIFGFMTKKHIQFDFTSNIQTAREIISEVHNYLRDQIMNLLPREEEIEAIKENLGEVQQEDLNHLMFEEIKSQCEPRSRDPFFPAFLNTQLVSVHLFKY